MKAGEGAMSKIVESFKIQVNSDLRDFKADFKAQKRSMLTLDDDVKKLIKDTEHNLLVKIDELKFN